MFKVTHANNMKKNEEDSKSKTGNGSNWPSVWDDLGIFKVNY